LGNLALRCFAFDFVHKPRQLLMVKRTTPAQLYCRVLDEPEAGFAFVGRRKILKRHLIKHYGFETFHASVARTRYHRRVNSVKYRNSETPAVIQGKPVAIGSLHRK
jgi:hypothetical protein